MQDKKSNNNKKFNFRARTSARRHRRGRAWIKAVVNPESTPTFK
jgi:hypothetical protein